MMPSEPGAPACAPPETGTPAMRADDLTFPVSYAQQRLWLLDQLLPSRTAFDRARGPVGRARVFRLAAEEHWLQLTLHHIVTDGWSMGVLARELSRLYAAYRHGEASPLPALPVQYADYAVWQRQWLQGEVLARQLGYWRGGVGGGGGGGVAGGPRRAPGGGYPGG